MTGDRVAVLGASIVSPRASARLQREEMVFHACRDALRQAGLARDDIGAVVQCSMDMLDGRIISSSTSVEPAGAYLKEEAKVAGDGLLALLLGWMRVLSGAFDAVMVVAQCKPSETRPEAAFRALFDPWFTRPLGLDRISAAALQARRFLESSDVTWESLAGVVAEHRDRGSRNPRLGSKAVRVEEVARSKILASPIRALDAAPFVDSAAALVLASKRFARSHPNPVWLAGAGHCVEEFFLGERALHRSRALEDAAARAYRMAGLRPADVDVAELHAEFSYQVPLWMSALGLDRGRTAVDPSGGSLAGHAPFVGGLARAAEAVLQLRGEAGPVQASGAKVALAHGAAGPCGQSQGVALFSK